MTPGALTCPPLIFCQAFVAGQQTEGELKRADPIARVRRVFHVQGWSVNKIVRELHVSRNTVRNILRTDETDFSRERTRQPLIRVFEELRGLGPQVFDPTT